MTVFHLLRHGEPNVFGRINGRLLAPAPRCGASGGRRSARPRGATRRPPPRAPSGRALPARARSPRGGRGAPPPPGGSRGAGGGAERLLPPEKEHPDVLRSFR